MGVYPVIVCKKDAYISLTIFSALLRILLSRNRSHSLAADRLLQGFNRGQGCTKRRILNGLCFETRKRLLAVRGESE
ncbi:MAG: hypothetical protein U9Q89_09650 [Thermodesulfobacteriota bacterium]|nr:hypothetical protein [Thermodesulfobacteriota bacterium]